MLMLLPLWLETLVSAPGYPLKSGLLPSTLLESELDCVGNPPDPVRVAVKVEGEPSFEALVD